MVNTENISNLLVRDGLSQSQRIDSTPETTSDNVKLDKRSPQDILDFIYRYSRYVLYYDEQAGEDAMSPAGDWQNFFNGSLPFLYSIISRFPIVRDQEQYFQVRNKSTLEPGELILLVNRVLAIPLQLNAWNNGLFNADPEASLYRMVDSLIQSDLSKALYRLIAIANTVTESEFDISELVSNISWNLTFDKLVAEDQSLRKYDAFPRRKMRAALAALDEVFDLFYKGIQQVQQFAGDHINDVLDGQQQHAAHLGLYYAFLKLFGKVTDGLNQVATRHLDFFYKDILQIQPKPFVPDHVHLTIELAKQTSDLLLPKNTALNAGKPAGKNLDFLLENEIVVNRATVSSLRTLFKNKLANIYVAPIANSSDGLGGAFRDPLQKSWPLLGAKSYSDTITSGASPANLSHYPFGVTGLLIASPLFVLKEGVRIITIKILLDTDLTALKSVLEEVYYVLDESKVKLLEKAGLGKLIKSLIPISPEPGWSVRLLPDDIKAVADDVKTKALAKMETSLLQPAYSSDKGWIIPAKTSYSFTNTEKVLSLQLTLPVSAVAMTAADPKVLQTDYQVNDPIIRLIFNHQLRNLLADKEPPFYEILSTSIIQSIDIDISVTGAKDLVLANDDGPVDGKKSFFPFTSVPKIGSHFYISSDEAFRKKFRSFSVNVTWDGLPGNLNDYYSGYSFEPNAQVVLNDSAVAESLLQNGTWSVVKPREYLFNTDGHTTPLLSTMSFKIDGPANQPIIHDTVPQIVAYDNAVNNGFLRFTINKHFYHLQYPSILAKRLLGVKDDFNKVIDNPNTGIIQRSEIVKTKATEADAFADQGVINGGLDAIAMAAKTELTRNQADSLDMEVKKLAGFVLPDKPGPVNIPLPPYTPAIKDISFNYEVSASAADVTLIHQYPYEETNFKQLVSNNTLNLFPRFDDEGTLYIGLDEAVPGSNVSLLFQLAEFSADPDIEEAKVDWYYLAGNEWHLLQPFSDVISDTSRGFQASGIVTIALPWNADTHHSLLPAGKLWLKAAALKNTTAVCRCVAVSAQGAEAVFVNQDNDLSRFSAPLDPGTIKITRQPKSEIKKIAQDVASFGGQAPENDHQYYLRVSERLRHKGRAINLYDYEHLVLEAFPAVFKIKCIPHTKMCLATAEGTLLQSPGWVTLAVIPQIKDFPLTSRSRPKVSRITLRQIEDFIKARTSLFVNIQVVNPRYQEVNFKGEIFLKKGKDRQFYDDKIHEDVRSFLSPWIVTGSEDIVFGGTLMMSSVLRYIEKRDYVEYVTDFVMSDANGLPVKGITATMPWAVLIAGKQDFKVTVSSD